MRSRHVFGFLFCLLFFQSVFAQSIIDRSYSAFFPKDLGDKIQGYQSFSASWWNLLVIDGVKNSEDFDRVTSFCENLRTRLAEERLDVVLPCGFSSVDLSSTLRVWSEDFYLRNEKPSSSEIHRRLAETLAKASLPVGSDLIQFFRHDPFQAYRDLQAKTESRFALDLERRGTFYIDENAQRVLIPVQLKFSPAEMSKTRQFQKILDEVCGAEKICDQVGFIGGHPSATSNESIVADDLDRVLVFSLIAISILLLVLGCFRLWNAILFVPAVGLGVLLSAGLTILVFGRIHGLTLSFGVGVIGLCVDYGFLSLFSNGNKKVWSTNLTGLMTTVSVFIVVGMSSIPLLQQLAFFSIVGLIFGFLILFWGHSKFPRWLTSKPFHWNLRPQPWKGGLVAFLCLMSVVGFIFVRPSLDMNQLNLLDAKSTSLNSWLFKKMKSLPPLFEIHSESEMPAILREANWADKNQIQIESLRSYLPLLEVQEKNLKTWQSFCEQDVQSALSSSEREFFEPFFSSARCNPRSFESLSVEPPAYVSHLFSKKSESAEWLTMWFPKTELEQKKIQDEFPKAESLRNLVSIFPKILSNELLWMVPLSILIVTLIHLYYFRNLFQAVLALLPFFSGMGVVTLGCLVFGMPFSFISLIAALMIYGFSLDYGIFSVEVFRTSHLTKSGAATALFFAALSTFLGFIPLAFCRHPVLSQLGQTLSLGAVGAYFGAIWGIPWMMRGKNK